MTKEFWAERIQDGINVCNRGGNVLDRIFDIKDKKVDSELFIKIINIYGITPHALAIFLTSMKLEFDVDEIANMLFKSSERLNRAKPKFNYDY